VTFTSSELRGRADRARALLEEQGLDALLVTGDFSAAMNYYWLSGHMPRDFQQNASRPHVMVLPRDGDPFLFVYDVNVENARASSWVDDVVAYTPPFDGVALAEALRARRLGSARIGFELGEDMRLLFPVGELRRLEATLPGVEVADASALIWRLRMLKSDEEAGLIEDACRVNDTALRTAFARLRAGDDEVDVARVVGSAMVEAGAVRPPYAQINVLSESKSRALGGASRLLGPLGEYALGDGDLLFVDSGAVISGYWGEFVRMAVVGEPSAAKQHHHAAIRSIVRRSIDEALLPGAGFREVVEHLVAAYRDHGYGEEQYGAYVRTSPLHYCHGVGLSGSEPPFVRHDSHESLEPGMVITAEAYLSIDGITYASEEDVLLTVGGNRLLSSPDSGLVRLG
jgi:Xaa-Pro aminopeptidase